MLLLEGVIPLKSQAVPFLTWKSDKVMEVVGSLGRWNFKGWQNTTRHYDQDNEEEIFMQTLHDW